MDEKIKKIEDYENSIRDKKAQDLKREREDMLKWAQQLKKVTFISFIP